MCVLALNDTKAISACICHQQQVDMHSGSYSWPYHVDTHSRNVCVHTQVQPKPASSDNSQGAFSRQPLSTRSASLVLQHTCKLEVWSTSGPTTLFPHTVTPLPPAHEPSSLSFHPLPCDANSFLAVLPNLAAQFVLISTGCQSIPLNFCFCSHYETVLHVSTQLPLTWWGWTAVNPKVYEAALEKGKPVFTT